MKKFLVVMMMLSFLSVAGAATPKADKAPPKSDYVIVDTAMAVIKLDIKTGQSWKLENVDRYYVWIEITNEVTEE